MKKVLLLALVVLISSTTFAQKKTVARVKSMVQMETPDFTAARQLIGEALENEETKGLADTWFVAGLIGYYQFKDANIQTALGKTVDQEVLGTAIIESYDYWLKADSIAQIPTKDKKGREVVDTKTRKNIETKLLEYYHAQSLVSYGLALNEKGDYNGAYVAFQKHLGIRDLTMMQQDPKALEQMPKDSIYAQYQYYTALFAIQSEQHTLAAEILEGIKDGMYEPLTCHQLLYQEYLALNDTVHFVGVLKEAAEKFPKEPWFLQNLINYYIFSGQPQAAIDYLNMAIEREPNVAQYHLIMGNLQANENNFPAADACYDKALELDPNMADAMAGKGRVFYNQGVKLNEEASSISDNKAYKKALEQMNVLFKQSLPFFVKAHEMDPTNRDYLTTLKSLYYRFNMTKEYDAIEAEIEAL